MRMRTFRSLIAWTLLALMYLVYISAVYVWMSSTSTVEFVVAGSWIGVMGWVVYQMALFISERDH